MSSKEIDKRETESDPDKLIARALVDPTKKRKAEDEIAIDLNQSIPLSKKQKRLLRRGKISLKELNDKYNIDPVSIESYKKEIEEKKKLEEDKSILRDDKNELYKEQKQEKLYKDIKGKKYGVWIGNLSFDTTKDDIIRYIVSKTKVLEDKDARVNDSDIIRFNLPLNQKDAKRVRNKGFAYLDFKNKEQMSAVIELSETQLNGRNLLIKGSTNYEGRPDKNDLVSLSKNPPSRILFVGNLPFDATEELLKKHFQHCGEITKVRMATFEDSGKCKGFAFVDFKNESGATNALTDKSCRKLVNGPLRMEYGEDRSKRQVKKSPVIQEKIINTPIALEHKTVPFKERTHKPKNRTYKDSNNRVKSSIALATAQRSSAAIVPYHGRKITFD